ncbi:MAG: uvrD/Rep helicase family protein [Dehalococcoidia bacterium]|nr:uvrD/Rep helicase family protein [Dehalococcoidia bacterium]
MTARIAIAPILLTKGLEFDAVVLAGTNKDSFTGSEFDTRLLYLACTRAKHWLHLHWSGPVSPSLR